MLAFMDIADLMLDLDLTLDELYELVRARLADPAGGEVAATLH